MYQKWYIGCIKKQKDRWKPVFFYGFKNVLLDFLLLVWYKFAVYYLAYGINVIFEKGGSGCTFSA